MRWKIKKKVLSFYNIEYGYPSLKELHRRTGVDVEEIMEILKRKPAYILHRNYKKNFKRRGVKVSYPDEIWSANLIDMNYVVKT